MRESSTLYKELLRLKRAIHRQEDLSYGDCLFLAEHQTEVKEYFPDDPVIWEFAGIPESEWNARG